MTLTRKAGVVLCLLAMTAFAESVRAGDYVISQAGYDLALEELRRANQVDLQPVALTAGEEYFDGVDVEDILLRCSVFAGRKGVRVTLEGSIAEGEDFEPTGDFAPTTKKTKSNGYAEFNLDFFDLDPLPSTEVEPPLLAALEVQLGGNQQLEEASVHCTLGVPLNTCTADDTTLCLQRNRFRVQAHWKDPFDGREREAGVLSSTPDSGTFFFAPLPQNINRVIRVLDNCGQPSRSFGIDVGAQSEIETTVVVTDTVTGVVKRYPPAAVFDSRSFRTCP